MKVFRHIVIFILLFFVYSLLSADQDNELGNLYFEIALDHYSQNKIIEAEKYIDISLVFRENSSDSFYLKGLITEQSVGRTLEAIDLFKKAEDKQTWDFYNGVECQKSISGIYFRTGRIDESITGFESIFEDKKDDPDFVLIYSKALIAAGLKNDAELLLRTILVTFPEDIRIHEQIALINSEYLDELSLRYLDDSISLSIDLLSGIIPAMKDSVLKDRLIELYLSGGGNSIRILIEEFRLSPQKTTKDIDFLLENGLLNNRIDIISLYKIIESSFLSDYLLKKLESFSGIINEDWNRDGYFETRTEYFNGIITNFIIDSNQDGIPEYDIYFSDGQPLNAFINNGIGKIIFFSEYPFLSEITFFYNESGKTYTLNPDETGYPFLYQSVNGNIFSPVISENHKEVAESEIKEIALSYKEFDTYNGEAFSQWIRLQGGFSIVRYNTEDQISGEESTLFYKDNPLSGQRDLNNDGIFEIRETYKDGVISAIYYDENNNNIPEFYILINEFSECFWDFDEDGKADRREIISSKTYIEASE